MPSRRRKWRWTDSKGNCNVFRIAWKLESVWGARTLSSAKQGLNGKNTNEVKGRQQIWRGKQIYRTYVHAIRLRFGFLAGRSSTVGSEAFLDAFFGAVSGGGGFASRGCKTLEKMTSSSSNATICLPVAWQARIEAPARVKQQINNHIYFMMT